MMKNIVSVGAALLLVAGVSAQAFAAAPQPQAEIAPDTGSAQTLDTSRQIQVADVGDFGAGVFVGVIGSLIAQGIAEERAREIRDEEWRWRKCDRRFRSFEWDTGMYTTYGGERRLCPYLR